MSKVADAHVQGGGMHPDVVIPAELTIALMGWVQMRVMTALNTIALGPDGDYVFGATPEPDELALVGQVWMRMLTLQLGIAQALLGVIIAPRQHRARSLASTAPGMAWLKQQSTGSLDMTLRYAKIANRTVADEYFAVTKGRRGLLR
jgi:hypothetical protein